MTLGSYLEAKGMTQQQFAEALGVSQAAVARYVKGRRTPAPEVLRKIAAKTDGEVTANDFVLVQGTA